MIRTYWQLTNPRVTALVAFTAGIGYFLGASGSFRVGTFLILLSGIWLTAAGTVALNQFMERGLDARMRRTRNRPMPGKRLDPSRALTFGIILIVVGVFELWGLINSLAGELDLLALGTYLFIYTPLKTRTPLCTLLGAIPGAIPPVIGWVSARGTLEAPALFLFLILFLWQLPHFLAIALLCRDDYARGSFLMMPVVDPEGGMTARMIVLYCAVLIPVSLMPAASAMTKPSYFWGALVLGMGFLFAGVSTAYYRSDRCARNLLKTSVIYLPALLTWWTLTRIL